MRTFLLGLFLIVPLWLARTAMAQANSGELRLRVTDSAGLGLKASVIVVSEGNGYREQLATDEQGNLDLEFLTYGIYQVQIVPHISLLGPLTTFLFWMSGVAHTSPLLAFVGNRAWLVPYHSLQNWP